MKRTSLFYSLAIASALLGHSATGHARGNSEPPQRGNLGGVCAPAVLRSNGYRDMLTRFEFRQQTRDAARASRFETSYRDASLRHPTVQRPSSPNSRASLPRYALRPVLSCG